MPMWIRSFVCENINLVIFLCLIVWFYVPRVRLCAVFPASAKIHMASMLSRWMRVKKPTPSQDSVWKTSNSRLCGLVALFDKSASSAFFHFTDLTDLISKNTDI